MPTTDQEIRWRDIRLAEQSRRIEELEADNEKLKEELRMSDLVRREYHDTEQMLFRDLVKAGWVEKCEFHNDYCSAAFASKVIGGFRRLAAAARVGKQNQEDKL